MNEDATIHFLERLERQLETADERGLARRRERLRRATTAAAALVVLAVVAGGVAVWGHWNTGDGAAGGVGGAGQGSLLQPAPSLPEHIGGPAAIPDVAVVARLVADPSGLVWLAGRTSGVSNGGGNGWVAYLESGAWHMLPVPFGGWGPFAPVSPDDMWFAVSGGFTHWDGATVTTASVPFLDGEVGWTMDMAATGADDVWAVGHRAGELFRTPGDGPGEHTQGVLPVAMHWDGSAWADPSVPEYPGRSSELWAVSAKDDEVWAVGWYEQKLGERDTGNNLPEEILHRGAIAIMWDGERWAKADISGLGEGDLSLIDVQVLGPDDVWVLGEDGQSSTSTAPSQQLVAHWDGKTWTRIPGPDGLRRNDDHPMYRTLSATSDGDLWLAGDGRLGVGDAELAHWDGSSWQVLPMADFDAQRGNGGIVGGAEATVLSLGPADVWFNAGFTSYDRDDPQAAAPTVAHWDGRSWARVALPD